MRTRKRANAFSEPDERDDADSATPGPTTAKHTPGPWEAVTSNSAWQVSDRGWPWLRRRLSGDILGSRRPKSPRHYRRGQRARTMNRPELAILAYVSSLVSIALGYWAF